MTQPQEDELREIIKTVKSKPRMILYTDVIGWSETRGARDQTARDDLWAISTTELQTIQAYVDKKVREARVEELEFIRDHSSGGGSWRRVIETRLTSLDTPKEES